MKRPPVALVGTTASGKSALAERVARHRGDLELVSVDSMTLYRGMDLATAKPEPHLVSELRYHLLDVADPAEEFTVARFQALADRALVDIERRGRQALLVGGTGLYLRAVVDRLELPGRWPDMAAALDREADAGAAGLATLYRRLESLDPVAAARIEPGNRRRIVRALEVTLGSGRAFSSFGPGLMVYPPTEVTMVGLPFDREQVDRRIEERVRAWLDQGLVDEVRALAARPGGLSRTARQALGYRELLAHVEQDEPLEACVAEAIRRTRAFARRQWAWLRRDPRIHWIEPGADPFSVLSAALAGQLTRGADRWETGAVERPLRLTKHHGAGNDFLVLLDPRDEIALDPAMVERLCDRRRGIGADGVLRLTLQTGTGGPEDAGQPVLGMELANADGSPAEMSGNGIRCLVQAGVLAGWVRRPEVDVVTGAGRRRVTYESSGAPWAGWASVAMGVARLGEVRSLPEPARRAVMVDMGNPHLVVLVDDPWTVDLEELAAAWVGPDISVNVEVVSVTSRSTMVLRVLERGAGLTLACGTGTCAAVAAAHHWELVDERVAVANPGGTLEVMLPEGTEGEVVLSGPVRHVADLEVRPEALTEPAEAEGAPGVDGRARPGPGVVTGHPADQDRRAQADRHREGSSPAVVGERRS